MLSRVVRSITSNLSKITNNSRRHSSDVVGEASKKEPIITSRSIVEDLATAEPEFAAVTAKRKSMRRFLRYGVYGLVGGLTGVGYVTYAYSFWDIAAKVKALEESIKNESALEKQGLHNSLARIVSSTAVSAADIYLAYRWYVGEHVQVLTTPSEKILPDLHPSDQHVYTLVLDLNETLLYSEWKNDQRRLTIKRPGVDDFLECMAQLYEVVVFTDETTPYVHIFCEELDKDNCIWYKLSLADTKFQDGEFYLDLSKLNRDPAKILYVSAHAFESCLQPENCVPIKPYKLEADKPEVVELQANSDTTLVDLIPFLGYVARSRPADIRTVLASYERKDIAKEFHERYKEHQRQMQERRRPYRLGM